MRIVKQISSLDKVRLCDMLDYDEICKKVALRGERISYQIAAKSEQEITGEIELISDLPETTRVYAVLNAVMDLPSNNGWEDVDYITQEPGLMPDILVPIEDQNNIWHLIPHSTSIWVEVDIPENLPAGEYKIEVIMHNRGGAECDEVFKKVMTVEVIEHTLCPQKVIYSRWIHIDCIADYHNVEVYSDAHWALINEYVKEAADMGMNLLMIPVHTPPLDTTVGKYRTCVQLVDIEKVDGKYRFSFEKFKKYVDILKSNGIKYFQIAPMFSQWGSKFAPNIKVTENGVCDYMFGWNVPSDAPEYKEFLEQYLAAICDELRAEGILDNTYFSISDEPNLNSMQAYKMGSEIVRSLVGPGKTIDALSNYEFYENGLVENPITVVSEMHEFLKHDIKNQWAYYCNQPQAFYPQDYMAMPLYRVRIIGVLMYKYGLKGFMQWGYNFYGSRISTYKINPYQTTSAGGRFPSGDAFVVYPSKTGAYPSLRAKVMKDALIDISLCETAEKIIGKQRVIEIIDEIAGMDLRFDTFPRDKRFFFALHDRLVEIIRNNKE